MVTIYTTLYKCIAHIKKTWLLLLAFCGFFLPFSKLSIPLYSHSLVLTLSIDLTLLWWSLERHPCYMFYHTFHTGTEWMFHKPQVNLQVKLKRNMVPKTLYIFCAYLSPSIILLQLCYTITFQEIFMSLFFCNLYYNMHFHKKKTSISLGHCICCFLCLEVLLAYLHDYLLCALQSVLRCPFQEASVMVPSECFSALHCTAVIFYTCL